MKWLCYAKDSKTPLDSERLIEILEFIYQEVPTEEREQLIHDILLADPESAEADQYFLSKLNTFFITALRDLTEYWVDFGEGKVLIRYEKDRVKSDEFCNVMLEVDSFTTKDIWQRRFKDAEQKELNNPNNSTSITLMASINNSGIGLASSTVGYIISEFKWLSTYRRVKEEMENTTIE